MREVQEEQMQEQDKKWEQKLDMFYQKQMEDLLERQKMLFLRLSSPLLIYKELLNNGH